MEFELLKQVKQSDLICDKHQEYLIYLSERTSPFCLSCQREQAEIRDKQEADKAAERHYRRKTVEVLRRQSITGNNELFDCDFDNFKVDCQKTAIAKQQAMELSNAYLTGDAFNTILFGNPGVGKSHLAMSMLKHVNSHSQPLRACLFISLVDLLAEVRESFRDENRGISEWQAIKMCTDADLLVLDDLGSEAGYQSGDVGEAKDFVQRVLFAILNARQSTIVTTNLTSDQLKRAYNPKVVSRILKRTNGHVINLNGVKDKRIGW